jgi:hypothetical protein
MSKKNNHISPGSRITKDWSVKGSGNTAVKIIGSGGQLRERKFQFDTVSPDQQMKERNPAYKFFSIR